MVTTKKSLTLVELMISAMLLGVVIAIPVAFDLFARTQLKIIEKRIALTNEGMYGVENIAKKIKESVGGGKLDTGIKPIYSGSQIIGVWIREDTNNNHQPDDNSGTNFIIWNNSLWMRSRVPYSSTFSGSVTGYTQLINSKIVTANSQLVPISSNGVNNGVRIRFALRERPTQPKSLQNPEVFLRIDIILNSNSIS